jgi:hypothetical protein
MPDFLSEFLPSGYKKTRYCLIFVLYAEPEITTTAYSETLAAAGPGYATFAGTDPGA